MFRMYSTKKKFLKFKSSINDEFHGFNEEGNINFTLRCELQFLNISDYEYLIHDVTLVVVK